MTDQNITPENSFSKQLPEHLTPQNHREKWNGDGEGGGMLLKPTREKKCNVRQQYSDCHRDKCQQYGINVLRWEQLQLHSQNSGPHCARLSLESSHSSDLGCVSGLTPPLPTRHVNMESLRPTNNFITPIVTQDNLCLQGEYWFSNMYLQCSNLIWNPVMHNTLKDLQQWFSALAAFRTTRGAFKNTHAHAPLGYG